MLLALSDVTYVLIGWFKFLLLKFLYEYGPRSRSVSITCWEACVAGLFMGGLWFGVCCELVDCCITGLTGELAFLRLFMLCCWLWAVFWLFMYCSSNFCSYSWCFLQVNLIMCNHIHALSFVFLTKDIFNNLFHISKMINIRKLFDQ